MMKIQTTYRVRLPHFKRSFLTRVFLAAFQMILIDTDLQAQEFNKFIDKDSLVQAIVQDFTPDRKREFLEMYSEGNEQAKEFLLTMFTMPKSSKAELIANINSNAQSIERLRSRYTELVPAGFTVYIEFNAAEKLVSMPESIDISIRQENYKDSLTHRWNLQMESDTLASLIRPLGWTTKTVMEIKHLFSEANCISIKNGDITEIGFARSGMGKYSLLLFKDNLTDKQIDQYNDGCSYLFYKDNIVLEYAGGAIGSQCFPD